jgi:hypothetical protein
MCGDKAESDLALLLHVAGEEQANVENAGCSKMDRPKLPEAGHNVVAECCLDEMNVGLVDALARLSFVVTGEVWIIVV